MSQSYRLKLSRPSLKLKVATRIPASITVQSPILLDRSGNIYDFSLDISALIDSLEAFFEPLHLYTDQEVTSGSTVAIVTTAKSVRVNKTVGSATILTVPLAAAMDSDRITIVDWKGDAGTNNITITPTSPETINGLSTWTLAANNASVALTKIAGVGYAV